MNTIEKFNLSVDKYYSDIQNDKNGRFRSWEWCYHIFGEARKKEKINDEYIDFLCIHLAFYLASWGMYRGSSFLLQKDYKVHKSVVEKILDDKYDSLYGCNFEVLENEMDLLIELVTEVKNAYKEIREDVRDSEREITDTLITKVLMGTLGCVPAYDQYFNKAIKSEKIASAKFGEASLRKLIKFYKENNEILECKRREITDYFGNKYPQMKLLDMGFWQIGIDN